MEVISFKLTIATEVKGCGEVTKSSAFDGSTLQTIAMMTKISKGVSVELSI